MTAGSVEAVAAVAQAWETACRSGDTARIIDQLSDDAAIWYNFEQHVEYDRNAYAAILNESVPRFRNRHYRDLRFHFHPGGFVEQATLVGETDNGLVETPFLLVATVLDGKIAHIAEYFDTTIMHRAGLANG